MTNQIFKKLPLKNKFILHYEAMRPVQGKFKINSVICKEQNYESPENFKLQFDFREIFIALDNLSLEIRKVQTRCIRRFVIISTTKTCNFSILLLMF